MWTPTHPKSCANSWWCRWVFLCFRFKQPVCLSAPCPLVSFCHQTNKILFQSGKPTLLFLPEKKQQKSTLTYSLNAVFRNGFVHVCLCNYLEACINVFHACCPIWQRKQYVHIQTAGNHTPGWTHAWLVLPLCRLQWTLEFWLIFKGLIE